MKKLSVHEAVGQTLCHDVTAITKNGDKGPLFRRGHVIKAEDVEKLLDIGKRHIFIWEPEADEVHEEDAARLVAEELLLGSGLDADDPCEGKYRLFSTVDGLLRVNSAGLKKLNSVEDYTIASLPDRMPVTKGCTLAGIRIVPLVTKRENVLLAVQLAKAYSPIFEVKQYSPLPTGIIITGSEIFYGRVEDAFFPVLEKKLKRYGANLLGVTKCPDSVEAILLSLEAFIKQGAKLVLFTGGMSVDADDVTPLAIRQSGAKMLCRGVAMQPGNMLTSAYLGKTLLLGVPGAALHFETTSLDIFLPRIFTNERLKKEDFQSLGEGGLCLGCKVCQYPKCYFGRK